MPKLTKRTVEAAQIKDSEYFLWDDEVPGFGLRVLPSGRKGFVVQYRAGRRPRRMSLGPSTVLTCEQARIRTLPIGEIAALPADQLALLEEDADAAVQRAVNLKERLQAAIALRYCDRAAAARIAQDKDSGTVRFDDGPVIPTVDSILAIFNSGIAATATAVANAVCSAAPPTASAAFKALPLRAQAPNSPAVIGSVNGVTVTGWRAGAVRFQNRKH